MVEHDLDRAAVLLHRLRERARADTLDERTLTRTRDRRRRVEDRARAKKSPLDIRRRRVRLDARDRYSLEIAIGEIIVHFRG